jgi:hypothetical protein
MSKCSSSPLFDHLSEYLGSHEHGRRGAQPLRDPSESDFAVGTDWNHLWRHLPPSDSLHVTRCHHVIARWVFVLCSCILVILTECMRGCLVSSGQPIGVMFTLIMGSNAGGFGLVSTPSTNNGNPYNGSPPPLVVHQYVPLITHPQNQT